MFPNVPRLVTRLVFRVTVSNSPDLPECRVSSTWFPHHRDSRPEFQAVLTSAGRSLLRSGPGFVSVFVFRLRFRLRLPLPTSRSPPPLPSAVSLRAAEGLDPPGCLSRPRAPLKFRGPNSPPVPAPTSGSPALRSQPLPSPSLRTISTPFASLALFRHSLYRPSLFVNGLRSSLSALSLFDSVRPRPLRAVSTSSIFAALLSSPSSLSSTTVLTRPRHRQRPPISFIGTIALGTPSHSPSSRTISTFSALVQSQPSPPLSFSSVALSVLFHHGPRLPSPLTVSGIY
jgi:hypothetical protein